MLIKKKHVPSMKKGNFLEFESRMRHTIKLPVECRQFQTSRDLKIYYTHYLNKGLKGIRLHSFITIQNVCRKFYE